MRVYVKLFAFTAEMLPSYLAISMSIVCAEAESAEYRGIHAGVDFESAHQILVRQETGSLPDGRGVRHGIPGSAEKELRIRIHGQLNGSAEFVLNT